MPKQTIPRSDIEFDPNGAASKNNGIFGLPFKESVSSLVYLPVPWEVTTSYGGGTSDGPKAIFNASHQVDLYDLELGNFWKKGLFMRKQSKQVATWNKLGKKLAAPIIRAGGVLKTKQQKDSLKKVNDLSQKLNAWVEKETASIFSAGQIPALIGGDHAVPFGAFSAAAKHCGEFGILHFDAHSDTRAAYEGFTWSHASIMHNALTRIPAITNLVQVGIRDFCEEEFLFTRDQGERVSIFYDEQLTSRKHHGETWHGICHDIVSKLPNRVWVSFDIDGLDPRFCPHTGTPVPGGLDYREAVSIIRAVVESGRTIIGFDLNEVAPGPKGDEWDGNVGARLLYKMTGFALKSQGLL